MKRVILNSWRRLALLLFVILTKGYAFAQTSLGDPAAADNKNAPPTGVFLQFFAVGIVLVLIVYAGYRYRRSKSERNKQVPPVNN